MPNSLPYEPVAFIGCLMRDPERVVIPGSISIPCRCCKQGVSLSPASIRRMRLCDVPLCIQCASDVATERGTKWREAPRNADQAHELKVLKSVDN